MPGPLRVFPVSPFSPIFDSIDPILTQSARSLTLRPTMCGQTKRLTFTVAILCALLFGSRPASRISAQQSSPQTASHEAILVLRNGHLLRGEISRVDDRYQVSVEGGKIYVKPADVELLCRHLDEAYQWKRARLFSDDARGHLELALWCQQHGLLGRAAEELANGMALAPAHPMIPLVERRLEMSLRPQPQVAETGQKASDEGPSLDELDRLVEQMPPGTMETYTQKAQPLLSNYCATAACHGPSTQTDFTLHRIPAHGPINRRLTQRNLHRTLQWIDRSLRTISRRSTPRSSPGSIRWPGAPSRGPACRLLSREPRQCRKNRRTRPCRRFTPRQLRRTVSTFVSRIGTPSSNRRLARIVPSTSNRSTLEPIWTLAVRNPKSNAARTYHNSCPAIRSIPRSSIAGSIGSSHDWDGSSNGQPNLAGRQGGEEVPVALQ